MANIDYPRMLFHRTQDPVTVHSREQEDALGPGWSRTIWPAKAAAPAPAHPPEPEKPAWRTADPEHWWSPVPPPDEPLEPEEDKPEPEPEPELEEQEEVAPIAPRQRPKPPPIKRPVAKGTRKKR
jgi:hypothetical protein